ncbi:MAG: accessory Sec system glycosylation protein GtfA, partial [Acetatifactor sp.]|nr:accessory Sec system glycosylation protein GtfA [Acetatifactor sp.]
MAIYIFNLLVGYVISGVEHAQGYRALALKDFSAPVKFVFTELPRKREIDEYKKIGIDVKQMLSIHHYFADNLTLESMEKTADKLAELKESLHYTSVNYQETEIRLIRNDFVVASILLEKTNKEHFYGIHYFNQGKMIRTEFYTGRIVYADSYVTARSDNGLYAKTVRRTFYKSDGSVAYEQIWKRNEERYLFPDGRLWTKSQFVAEFVKRLHLSERDIVFLDRSAQFDFVQPLFQFGGKARFMAFFHSGHYFEKGEDPW